MPQFRSRKIIEAVQWNGKDFGPGEQPAWLTEAFTHNLKRFGDNLFIGYDRGDIPIPVGSWVFRTTEPPGVDAYQEDAFASAYEMVAP